MSGSTPLPRPRSPWLLRGLVVAVVLALVPSTAGAEPTVEDLERSAENIAKELHRLDLRTSELDEEHNVARLELEQLEATIATMEADVAAARDEVDSTVSAAIDYAVEAYTGGGADEIDLFASADPVALAGRRTFLETLSATNYDAVRGLTVARDELAAQERSLNERREELADRLDRLEADRAELESLVAERTALADSVSSDLEAAVAAEQQRIAAERAEAAAAAAATRSETSTTTSAPVTSTQRRVASTTLPTTPSSSSTVSPPTTVAPPPVSAPSAGLAKAVEVALAQRGDPYRWAASGPDAFDCSGLVTYSYGAAGYSLPHSSRSLFNMTQRLTEGQLQPGDLVFGGSPVHHVGIYIGGGQMVHAPNSGSVVRIDGIYNTSSPVRFGRL